MQLIGIMDANVSLKFVTLWHIVRSQILSNWKSSHNKRQCGISIIYNSHELSTQNSHEVVPHYSLKKLSIMIDFRPCWINSIIMKKHGTDPSLDNQIGLVK